MNGLAPSPGDRLVATLRRVFPAAGVARVQQLVTHLNGPFTVPVSDVWLARMRELRRQLRELLSWRRHAR